MSILVRIYKVYLASWFAFAAAADYVSLKNLAGLL